MVLDVVVLVVVFLLGMATEAGVYRLWTNHRNEDWKPTICAGRVAGFSCTHLALPGERYCSQHRGGAA